MKEQRPIHGSGMVLACLNVLTGLIWIGALSFGVWLAFYFWPITVLLVVLLCLYVIGAEMRQHYRDYKVWRSRRD